MADFREEKPLVAGPVRELELLRTSACTGTESLKRTSSPPAGTCVPSWREKPGGGQQLVCYRSCRTDEPSPQ